MKRLAIICLVVIIAISLTVWAEPSVSAQSDDSLGNTGDITITLEAGQYEINQVGEYSVIEMEGFGSVINPGEPKLPSKTFLIGLPPGAKAVSVDMVTSDYVEIPGEYHIMPAPPIVSLQENEKAKWEENEEIYSSENAYPSSVYEHLGMGQMRKYYFARVRFCPIAYYPASNKLGLYRSITLKIKYEISQVVPPELLSDTVMEDVASEIILNYASMKSQYKLAIAPSPVSYDYVIITSESLQNAAEPLVTWKTAIGYSVNVVTTSWISSNYSGIDLPEKIRNFLIDKYAEWGIEYVLIVGSHSIIPMRYCYPDPSDHGSDVWSMFPTDYYYADLNGNWDSDGDGYFGEDGQDNVDFYPEVYVGRIPVDDGGTVTAICQKSVDFEQDSGAWKKKALLLGGIANYENQDGYGCPKKDAAALMEASWNNILEPNGYSSERMYEKAGLAPSTYACDHPLTNSNVLNASYGWPSGYGIVNWGAHAGQTAAYRKVWAWDDGDGVPESAEMTWPAFIQSSDSSSLDPSKPAIVFSCSCLTAYPENADNLGNSLLQQGAVAFVGATRPAAAVLRWENEGDGGCQSIDYYFFHYLINGNRNCGDALYMSKVYCHDYLSGNPCYHNMYTFCLYGEPSLGTATICPPNPSLQTHLLATMYKGIRSPADLNYAKVCLSWSPYSDMAEIALGTYGIEYSRVYIAAGEGFLALKRGVVDAVLVTEHPWDAVVADNFETEVSFLPWSNQAIEAVETQFSWVTSAELPANTYPWQTEAVPGYTSLNQHPPQLSSPSVQPPSGTPSTDFYYYVHYYDSDGDSPGLNYVQIDDTGYAMSLHSGIAPNGVYRYGPKYLAVGSHNYHFYFQDSKGEGARLPASGSYSGPTVSQQNNPPQLSNPSVQPTSGTPSTNFYYDVNYYDSDGDSPSVKRVYIDGTPYTMGLQSGSASNGVYRYAKNLDAGSHSYYFYFEDGKGGAARLPTSGSYSGPVVGQENNPPNTPSNPSLGNHASGVSINADLSWTGGDPDAGDTVTYYVYFGTSPTPPLEGAIGPYPATQTSIAYSLGTLAYDTTYYWRILARDNQQEYTMGPLWDFTTGSQAGDEDDPDVATGLASLEDELVMAYGFKAGEGVGGWTVCNPEWAVAHPEWNTLTTLYVGRGYWINVSGVCDLTYGANTYELDEGWNLIGWVGY